MVSSRQMQLGFCLIAVLFVVVQIYLYRSGPRLHPIDEARISSRAYITVRDFLTLCDKDTIHVILVDPWILRDMTVESWEDAKRPCRFLCRNHVYTFAIRDKDFEIFNSQVLTTLLSKDFTIRVAYKSGGDGEIGEIPTHIYLRDHDHHAIHVVVLHWKGNFWWYGADPNDEYRLDFTQHEGALDNFDYNFKVTIDGVEVFMPHYPKRFLEEYEVSKFIECNVTRAKQFYQLYPKDETKNSTEFRRKAVDVIEKTKRRLDDLGVKFWLSSGTLLGWYRQCDIISYSMDVDFGVFIKDHIEDFIGKMKRTGMQLDHKFGKLEDSLQYAFDMGDIKLDIFFFYEDQKPGKVWNGGTDYQTGQKYKYTFDSFHLCWTEFYRMKVRVPCETEPYIRSNYGPQWFHPVTEWDWKRSPPNVEEVASWKDDELEEVIQLFDKKGKRLKLEWVKDDL